MGRTYKSNVQMGKGTQNNWHLAFETSKGMGNSGKTSERLISRKIHSTHYGFRELIERHDVIFFRANPKGTPLVPFIPLRGCDSPL